MSRPLLVPLIVACALFMQNTDSTVIATSLPVIARDLGEDPIALKLALTSYLVSLAIFIPISGWMADRYGGRTVFRLSLGVFMAGSLMCAASSVLAAFVGARFLQGMGGAMMVPVGRLILLRSVPKSEFLRVMAFLSVPAMVGPVIGPPLGGLITTYLDWRWIFFINIPIGLLGIVLSSLYIENVKEDERAPFDTVGFLLAGIGLASLMLGLATAGRHLLPGHAAAVCVAVGALALAAYVWHARRTPTPVIDLRLLNLVTFRAGVVGGLLFRVGIGALPFLLPLLMQLGFGMTPFQSGLVTFASAAGAMFVKTLATRILRRFGFRGVLIVNALVSSVLLGAAGLFTPATPHAIMLAVLFVGGCFRSLQFTAMNAISYAEVAPRDMSRATSFAGVSQQVALSMGVTIGAFALELSSAVHGHASPAAGDFWPAFVTVSLISASALLFALPLAPDAGTELSGHVRRPAPRKVADHPAE